MHILMHFRHFAIDLELIATCMVMILLLAIDSSDFLKISIILFEPCYCIETSVSNIY